MNEFILVCSEDTTEFSEFDTESIVPDTEYSQDGVVSDTDISDSGTSDTGSSGGVSDTSSVVSESAAEPDQTSVSENIGSGSTQTYYDSDLGGYPVVIMGDYSESVSTYATYEDYYTMLSTQWCDYFKGVLDNLGDTEYIAYCLRDYDSGGSSYSYLDHYVLVYDLEVENDALVSGAYPCIDIYRADSVYYKTESTVLISSVPDMCYGSFGTLSDVRGGVSHAEMYALLFAVGFGFVYAVVHDIFEHIHGLLYRKG